MCPSSARNRASRSLLGWTTDQYFLVNVVCLLRLMGSEEGTVWYEN